LQGDNDGAELLQLTRDEEIMTDKTLTGLAEQINLQAFDANQSEATNLTPARRRRAGRA